MLLMRAEKEESQAKFIFAAYGQFHKQLPFVFTA
jgi:hypothetical protein